MKEDEKVALKDYLGEVRKLHRQGIAGEHSYRGPLQNFFKTLCPGLALVNEPARIECGAPDLVLLRRDLPIGYIEAKDLGKDLAREEKSEQMGRYLPALDNLILTDYLEFRFFRNGRSTQSVHLAEIRGDRIVERPPEDHELFLRLVADFAGWKGVQIRSAVVLAEKMAKKARLMRDIFRNVLAQDPTENNPLQEQLAAFRSVLMHDLDAETFADIYAQTLAYGMFAARLHDDTPETFSRQEAAELVPKSNPFLRNLFCTIAAVDLDERIAWIVNDLVDIFRTVDLKAILADFGKDSAQNDPFIHFYETFLAAYDPALRKGCGVYYTPDPVVRFIVRAVDQILQTTFGLPAGLADASTITRPVREDGAAAKGGKDKLIERTFHKVQILDPATGTGTFLAEAIRHIHSRFAGQEGLWPTYVEKDLIPRLNGFEILMASYAVCHLKLELLLRQTGVESQNFSRRLNVFLTNSLEEADPATGTLFASWLSREAREANRIKRDSPVMVVLGNPPYAVSSSNKSEWIQTLIADYKKNLNERKLNLDDDYIKFIRMGQHYVEKNGTGILAYISANSFIDGITHRQMRRSLMETFDEIYILDLHGNAKKKETCPDGSKDENVFDIMTGVSINVFVKTGQKPKGALATVRHHELLGLRKRKYEVLETADFSSLPWKNLAPVEPSLFFVPKDFSQQAEYEQGFPIESLFPENNTGIQTKRDNFVYHFESNDLQKTLADLKLLPDSDLRVKYDLADDGRDWSVAWAREDVVKHDGKNVVVHYHPFDKRQTFFTGTTKGFMAYPRMPLMGHLLHKNIALLLVRNSRRGNVNNVFVADTIVDKDGISPFDNAKVFPLYLYPEGGGAREPNLDPEIVAKIASGLELRFVPEATGAVETFAPLDLLDYIYAVLHTPSYREKYKEFLKIDFPRVPYPSDAAQFRKLATLGGELRSLHLMESPKLGHLITTYPVAGGNAVEKISFADGQVWINSAQYVGGVPEEVWNFYIGGYQPAQKWLKDRKGRTLAYDDIKHYQQILVALAETIRLMAELDRLSPL